MSILNAPARLATSKRKFDHITGTMRDELHWLPVRQHILFILCTLISKCLRRSAPSYLTDMCIPVSIGYWSITSTLRSCSRRDLRIPRCQLSRYGARSFAVSRPEAWNGFGSLLDSVSILLNAGLPCSAPCQAKSAGIYTVSQKKTVKIIFVRT